MKVWWSFCAPCNFFLTFSHPKDQKRHILHFLFFLHKKNDMGPKHIWTGSCSGWVAAPGPLGTQFYVTKPSVRKAQRMSVVLYKEFCVSSLFLFILYSLSACFSLDLAQVCSCSLALIFVMLLIGSEHGEKNNSETRHLSANSHWYLCNAFCFGLVFWSFFSTLKLFFFLILSAFCRADLAPFWSLFCFLRSRTQNNLFCHLLWTWERSVKDATFSVACYWKTLVVNTDATYPNIYCCSLLMQVSMQVIFDLFLLFHCWRRCLDFSISKTQVCRFKVCHFDHSITFDYIQLCRAASPPVWFVSLVVFWPW